jgi:hypothetical protein
MYGKIFQRMYQGSMVGSGPVVFAVWGYCIANADPESHLVDLNPALLATIIGTDQESIKSAVEFLGKPDPNSHNKEHEGRRILNTTGFEYFLVSHSHYREITNNQDLRQYFREKKREQRETKRNVLDSLGQSQDPASASDPCSSLILRGSAEGELVPAWQSAFEECWKQYPDKSGKDEARIAFKKAYAEGTRTPEVLAGMARYAKYIMNERANGFKDRRVKTGGQWFKHRGWQDEYTMEDKRNARVIYD